MKSHIFKFFRSQENRLANNKLCSCSGSKCPALQKSEGLREVDCSYKNEKISNPLDSPSFEDGTKCTFSCYNDFVVVGSKNFTCNGESWSPKQPHCSLKSKLLFE